MKVVDCAQFRLWPRLAQHHGARQSRQQRGEVKSAVEAVGSFGQIAPRVLGVPDGVVAAADGALGVAQHHIHPTRALDLGGGASASGFEHRMRMIQLDDTRPPAERRR